MSALVRDNAVVPMTPAEDQTNARGQFVRINSNQASLVTATTQQPFGIVLDGDTTTGKSSIGVLGGLAGTVKVKINVGQSISGCGVELQLEANGTVRADAGTGARKIVGRSLEAGNANELIEAVVYYPIDRT